MPITTYLPTESQFVLFLYSHSALLKLSVACLILLAPQAHGYASGRNFSSNALVDALPQVSPAI